MEKCLETLFFDEKECLETFFSYRKVDKMSDFDISDLEMIFPCSRLEDGASPSSRYRTFQTVIWRSMIWR